jgi:Mor family transcriptional regulator
MNTTLLSKEELINIIPEDLQIMVDIVGIDKTIEIIKKYEGTYLYFNKDVSRALERAQIVNDFMAGKSYNELAKKYGFSSVWIREIIEEYKDKKYKNKSALITQKSLF